MRSFMAHTSGMLSTLQVQFTRLVAATAAQPQAPAPEPAAAPQPNLALPVSPSARASPMPPSARVAASEGRGSSGGAAADSASIVPAPRVSESPGGAISEQAPAKLGSPNSAHAAAADPLAAAARPRSAAAGQLGALVGSAQGLQALQAPEQPRMGPRPAPYGGTPAERSSCGQHARPALSRIQQNCGGGFAAPGPGGLTKEHSHLPPRLRGAGLPTEAAEPGDGKPVQEAAPAGRSLTGAITPAGCWHGRCESGPALRSAPHGQRGGARPRSPAAGKLASRQAVLARGAPAPLPWGGGPAAAEATEYVWPCDAYC